MVRRIFSRVLCASVLCFSSHTHAEAEESIKSELPKTNAMDSIHFTLMRFHTSWSCINKEGKAWKNRDTDASFLVHKLFDLVEKQQASLDLDVSVNLAEWNKECILQSAESDIYYASGTNGLYSLVKYETPIGRRLVACLEQMQINGNTVPCIRLFFRDTSLIGREEFKPFPSLDGGKPILHGSVLHDISSVALTDDKEYILLSHGGNSSELEINICRVQRFPK